MKKMFVKFSAPFVLVSMLAVLPGCKAQPEGEPSETTVVDSSMDVTPMPADSTVVTDTGSANGTQTGTNPAKP